MMDIYIQYILYISVNTIVSICFYVFYFTRQHVLHVSCLEAGVHPFGIRPAEAGNAILQRPWPSAAWPRAEPAGKTLTRAKGAEKWKGEIR